MANVFTIHSFAVIVNGSQTSERMPTRRTCGYYSLQIEMFIEKFIFFGMTWRISFWKKFGLSYDIIYQSRNFLLRNIICFIFQIFCFEWGDSMKRLQKKLKNPNINQRTNFGIGEYGYWLRIKRTIIMSTQLKLNNK